MTMSRITSKIEPTGARAQFKNDCLRRDGWKCIITGAYDPVAATMTDTSDARALSDDSECAHIIPFAFGSFSESRARYYVY